MAAVVLLLIVVVVVVVQLVFLKSFIIKKRLHAHMVLFSLRRSRKFS